MTNDVRQARNNLRLPKAMIVVSLIVILAAAGLVFYGAYRVGVTWDERIHAVMLKQYFTNGWYASPDWLVNGHPDAFLGKWPYYVYAPVAALVGHAVAEVSGAEAWGGFSESPAAYTARHLAAGFMALIGVLAAGLTVRVITRSWRWGVLGAAMVASIPMWVGHGMFNGKDLPVATGYTLATLGLIVMLTRNYESGRWIRAGAVASLVLGLVLAVGTRPASGLPIVLTGVGLLLGFGIYALVRRRSPSWLPHLGRRSLDIGIGFLAGYLALVVIYPKGFINPLTLAKETLLISGRFPVNDAVLTSGMWLAQPPPWFYLPTWFGFQLPLLVLAGSAVFVVAWAVSLFKALQERSGNAFGAALIAVPVLLQTLLLPVLAIAAHSTMYNAVRQFLFVVPAMAILATLGVRKVADRLRGPWRVVLWVVVAIGLLAPVVDAIRLFPYSYTYFNEMTIAQGVNGRWATDYWRASSQEVTRRIPSSGPVVCHLPKPGDALSDCGLEASYAPFWTQRGADATAAVLPTGGFWFARENNGDLSIPQGCTLHDTISRPLRSEDLVIAQIFRCGPAAR